jgi:hypothetical protein
VVAFDEGRGRGTWCPLSEIAGVCAVIQPDPEDLPRSRPRRHHRGIGIHAIAVIDAGVHCFGERVQLLSFYERQQI